MVEKIKGYVDVIIVGGGMAGFTAAVSAARKGCQVVLIEKNECLGGLATSGMISEIIAMYKDGQIMVPHISAELMERMIKIGAAKHWGNVFTSVDESVQTDRLRYNSEYLKIILDQMAEEAGVAVILTAEVCQVKEGEEDITAVIHNGYHEFSVCGKILIDATGNANSVYMANPLSTVAPPKEMRQAVTTIFKLGGVDTKVFLDKLCFKEVQRLIQLGCEKGVFPTKVLGMCSIAGTDQVSFNCTRVANVNHESITSVSYGLRQTRQQIFDMIPFLKKEVAGCQNAYLSNIASGLGVRDRRRINAEYEMKGDELIQAVVYSDAVAVGCYPADFHIEKDGKSIQFCKIQKDGIYTISYRSLLPKETKRILAAGKCIGGDDIAHAAFRTMGPIQCIGNAAGVAAALAIKQDKTLRQINIEELQSVIRKDGVPKI